MPHFLDERSFGLPLPFWVQPHTPRQLDLLAPELNLQFFSVTRFVRLKAYYTELDNFLKGCNTKSQHGVPNKR